MKIDLAILQIAIIFLPGLIWARLDAQYAAKTKPTDLEFTLRAFMFGLTSYAVTYVIYSALGHPFTLISFTDAEKAALVTAPVGHEVIVAVGVGVVLALLWLYFAKFKILTVFLQKIGATNTYGDEDVWDYTFNSSSNQVDYINFRDLENSLVYTGYVDVFSESEKLRELVLSDVQVYDFEGKMLFGVPRLYLARKPESIHIEFPISNQEDKADD